MSATRVWTAGAVILIGAILALGWFLGAAPLLSQAAAADTERVAAESQTAAQRAALETMKADFARLDEIQDELRGLQSSVPVAEQIDTFAIAVEQIALGQSVKLMSITSSEMPFGSSADNPVVAAGTGGVITTTPAGSVYAIPVTIGLEGDGPALFAALRDLQTQSRLFVVNSVTLTGPSTEGDVSTASIVGYIFLLTDRPLAATPEEAATAELGPGSTYQVPDVDGAIPGGEESEETPAPTPTETPTGRGR